MKPFLRSPLLVVGVVLIVFTVLSVTTVFLSTTSLIADIASSISELIKWELVGSKYGFPDFSTPGFSISGEQPTENVSVDEGVRASKEILEKLSSDARISNFVIIQIIRPHINYSDLNKVKDPHLLRLMPVLVLYGIRLSDLGISQDAVLSGVAVSSLNVTLDVVSDTNITKVNLLNLLFDGLNYTTKPSRELNDLLDGLREITCLESYSTQFYYSCSVYNPLLGIKSPLIYDSSTFEYVGLDHLKLIKDRLRILNISVDYHTRYVLVFIDLKTESYFNPASIQGSLENARVVAHDLRDSLGLARLTNEPLQEVLGRYQIFETTFRISSVTSVVPAFVALVLVLQPISEMLVLSVRRVFGLMRVRGISRRVVRKWFYGVLLFSLVGGLCLGLLASYVLAISYFRLHSPMQVLLDPVILIVLAVLLAIELLILARKISRVSSGIPPAETLKTTLVPESLLEPMKMGIFGWFSVGVGLYFIITGITSYSASRILATSLIDGSGDINVVLIVLLVIGALIESLLKPFAPAIAVYGFVKLYMINHEKFWDLLHKSVLSKSTLALPSKSIALTIRRRVAPVLVLLAFSTSVMTQTVLYGDSMSALIDSATRASAGSNYLLRKSLIIYLTNNTHNTTLRELLNANHYVLNIISRNYENTSIILVLSPIGVFKSDSTLIASVGDLAIVLNPDTFLQNTYWYNEWSLRGNLSNSFKEISLKNKTIAVFNRRFLTDFKNVSVHLTRLRRPYSSPPTDSFSFEVIDVWVSFPGGQYLTHPTALIAGDWMLDVPNLTESLLDIGSNFIALAIYAYSLSKADAEELISEGFMLVESLEDLENDPLVRVARSLMTSAGGSSGTYVIFMLLSAGIAAIVAYVVAVETSKTALLMRVRGLTPLGMLKLNSLYWFVIVATSVVLGVVVGSALGISDLNIYASPIGFDSPTLLFSQLLGSRGVYLGLGALRVVVSPVLVLAILLVSVLIPLVPILTIQLVYRGHVRERFIEVR